MESSETSAPPGVNPYLYGATKLRAYFYWTPTAGFETRLWVLASLSVVALIMAIIRLVILLLDNRRRKLSIWFMMRAKRPGGNYIVINTKWFSSLFVILNCGLVLTEVHNLLAVFFREGSQPLNAAIRGFTPLSMLVHVWVLVWGQIQSYLITTVHIITPSHTRIPWFLRANFANALFIGTTAFFAISTLAPACMSAAYGAKVWRLYSLCQAAFTYMAKRWLGPGQDTNGLKEIVILVERLENFKPILEDLRIICLCLYSFGEAMVVCIILLNVTSFVLARYQRQRARTYLASFHASFQAESEFESIVRPAPIAINLYSAGVPIETNSSQGSFLQSSRKTSFGQEEKLIEKPALPAVIETDKGIDLIDWEVGKLKAVAGRAETGLQGELAKLVLVFVEAEAGLLKMASRLGGTMLIIMVQGICTIIFVARNKGHEAGWPIHEALLTFHLWLYTLLMFFTEPFLIRTAWSTFVQHHPTARSSLRKKIGHALGPITSLVKPLKSFLPALPRFALRRSSSPSQPQRRPTVANVAGHMVRVVKEEHVTEHFNVDPGFFDNSLVQIEGGKKFTTVEIEPMEANEMTSEGGASLRVGHGLPSADSEWIRPAWACDDTLEIPATALAPPSPGRTIRPNSANGIRSAFGTFTNKNAPTVSSSTSSAIPWEWRLPAPESTSPNSRPNISPKRSKGPFAF